VVCICCYLEVLQPTWSLWLYVSTPGLLTCHSTVNTSFEKLIWTSILSRQFFLFEQKMKNYYDFLDACGIKCNYVYFVVTCYQKDIYSPRRSGVGRYAAICCDIARNRRCNEIVFICMILEFMWDHSRHVTDRRTDGQLRMDRRTATDACGAGHYLTYGLMLCSLQYYVRVAGVVPSGSGTFRRVTDNVLVDLTQWPFSCVRVLRSVAHCQYGIAMTVKMYRMMSFRNAVSTVVVQYHHLTINTLTHINVHKLCLILLSAFSV